MESYICNFCLKTFTSKIILTTHQLNAKYCLKIQGVFQETEKKTPIFECINCNKIFSTKYNLNIHTKNCKTCGSVSNKDIIIKELKDQLSLKGDEMKEQINVKDNEIIELKRKNELLESKLEIYKSDHACIQEIAKQPKTINTLNNNKYNYLTPLVFTRTDVSDKIESQFTKDHFLDGQKGVADFTYNNLLLDDNKNCKYICNDVNRNTFIYKTKDGDFEKDYKGMVLTDVIFDDVVKKSTTISNTLISKNQDNDYIKNKCIKSMIEIKGLKDNNSEYITTLKRLVNMKHNQNPMILESDNIALHITYDFMKDQSQFLTIDHILNGLAGFVKYTLEYPFKNRIVCSDFTSKTLNYTDYDNKLVIDVGGFAISEMLFKSIEKQYITLFTEYKLKIADECNKYISELKELSSDEETENCNNKLDIINEPLDKLIVQHRELHLIFKGNITNFLFNFIEQVCLKTISC